MKRNCVQQRRQLAWLALGELSRKERAELEEHLRNCESCRNHNRELSTLTDEIAKFSHAADSVDLPAQARLVTDPRLFDSKDSQSWFPFEINARWQRFGVAALVLVIAVIVIFREPSNRTGRVSPARATTTLEINSFSLAESHRLINASWEETAVAPDQKLAFVIPSLEKAPRIVSLAKGHDSKSPAIKNLLD
jgi:anti-sigma factor RsiW